MSEQRPETRQAAPQPERRTRTRLAILLVNADVTSLPSLYLRIHGEFPQSNVYIALGVDAAAALVNSNWPDLALVDVGDGGPRTLQGIAKLRARSSAALIALTRGPQEQIAPRALGLGADDCVTDTIIFKELVARMRAALRRTHRSELQLSGARLLEFPGLVIDLTNKEVFRHGRPVAMTPTEFALLTRLAANPGNVVPIQALETASVKSYIHRLRQKLEDSPTKPVLTRCQRGIGYRFIPPKSAA